jgi:hypothetical protein
MFTGCSVKPQSFINIASQRDAMRRGDTPRWHAAQVYRNRNGKCGNDLKKLCVVIEKLVNAEELGTRYKDHLLQGKFEGARDCHITPFFLKHSHAWPRPTPRK